MSCHTRSPRTLSLWPIRGWSSRRGEASHSERREGEPADPGAPAARLTHSDLPAAAHYAEAVMLQALPFADLDTRMLYALLRLRCDIFVVEQQCVYPELDGRDDEPGTL